MTTTEVWDFLYNWTSRVLDVPVVESHQDAPAPEGTYVTIDYAGSWRLAGTAPSHRIQERPDLPSPRVFVYRGSAQVREVDGDGENLLRLIESLDDPNYTPSFGNNGLSILKTSGPVAMPVVEQSQWRRESVLTLELSWARAYAGSTLTIDSVSVTQEDHFGTVDAQEVLVEGEGRSVVEAVEEKNEILITTEA